MTSTKHDEGKPRWELLPKGVINLVVHVFTYGAIKYKDHGWREVPNGRARYYDAMNRHIDLWWQGCGLDQETKLPHLAHAAACALILLARQQEGIDK